MTSHRLLLSLLAFATGSLGCAREATHVAHTALICDDLGAQAHESPLVSQSGPIEVSALRVDDLDDYDAYESPLAPRTPAGVRISFPAPKGWTRPWLQRWTACYRGNVTARAGGDLLGQPNTDVVVRAARGRFVLDVTAQDPEVARRLQSIAATDRDQAPTLALN